jgi:hypothetical protein
LRFLNSLKELALPTIPERTELHNGHSPKRNEPFSFRGLGTVVRKPAQRSQSSRPHLTAWRKVGAWSALEVSQHLPGSLRFIVGKEAAHQQAFCLEERVRSNRCGLGSTCQTLGRHRSAQLEVEPCPGSEIGKRRCGRNGDRGKPRQDARKNERTEWPTGKGHARSYVQVAPPPCLQELLSIQHNPPRHQALREQSLVIAQENSAI